MLFRSQDTLISVCRATPGSISSNPAVQFSNDGSGGFLADTSHSKSQVGFGVKYTNKGTNPQGKVQLEIKSDHNSAGQIDGKIHTYQIDSNSISTLNVSLSSSPTVPTTATFEAKCNVTELLDNGTTVCLDGGALITLTLNSTAQTIGVTVNKSKNNGGMWFSSSWSGTKTVEKPASNASTTVKPITIQ